MAAYGYPSGTNTYVPNHAASNSLVVGFSRSPDTFRLPMYSQYIPAKNNQGLYWPDAANAPQGESNLEEVQWSPFLTVRRCYPFLMGRLAVEQATYPILAAHAGLAAQQAMTARTMLAYYAMANASWGNNTAAVNGTILAGGQDWTTGSVGYSSNPGPNIKTSLQYGSRLIHQATIGVVQPSQLTLVVNPKTAQAMAASTEIQDYIKQSPFAMAQLRGDVPNQNGQWGLPTRLYGTAIAVEDTVRITSRQQATTLVTTYVVPNTEAYLMARQGELEGIEGTRSYSTLQIFFYQDELTVFSKYDSDNEVYRGRVVTNFKPVLVAPSAGFKFTAVQAS